MYLVSQSSGSGNKNRYRSFFFIKPKDVRIKDEDFEDDLDFDAWEEPKVVKQRGVEPNVDDDVFGAPARQPLSAKATNAASPWKVDNGRGDAWIAQLVRNDTVQNADENHESFG